MKIDGVVMTRNVATIIPKYRNKVNIRITEEIKVTTGVMIIKFYNKKYEKPQRN